MATLPPRPSARCRSTNGTATLKRAGNLTFRSGPNSMPVIMPIPSLRAPTLRFLLRNLVLKYLFRLPLASPLLPPRPGLQQRQGHRIGRDIGRPAIDRQPEEAVERGRPATGTCYDRDLAMPR